MTAKRVVLRVLFFHDPQCNAWIAQALERDIAAFGTDLETAKRAFEQTVAGYLRAPGGTLDRLDAVAPAPDAFWEAWDRVASATMPAERLLTIPAYMMPAVSHDDPLPA